LSHTWNKATKSKASSNRTIMAVPAKQAGCTVAGHLTEHQYGAAPQMEKMGLTPPTSTYIHTVLSCLDDNPN